MRSALFVLAALSLGALDALAATFANCIAAADVPTDGINSGSFSTLSLATCQTDCAAYAYAYWSSGSTVSCYCSNTEPASTWVTTTESIADDTTCATATDYETYKLSTSYTFEGCVTAWDDTPGYTLAYVTNFEQCLTVCSGYQYAMIQAQSAGSQWYCDCQTALNSPTNSICGPRTPNNYYLVYYHPASASGLARRRRVEQLQRRQQQALSLCPGSMTACNVAGVPGSYECIDTTAELESCGGCVAGSFSSSNGTSGTDCSTMPGVEFGGVTCRAGQCAVSSCSRGYSLVGGECVRA